MEPNVEHPSGGTTEKNLKVGGSYVVYVALISTNNV